MCTWIKQPNRYIMYLFLLLLQVCALSPAFLNVKNDIFINT